MSSNPNQSLDDSQAWEACPAGELQNLSTRLKNAERRRQQISAGKMAGLTAAATACLVVGLGMLFGDGGGIAGLSCPECQANFTAYFDHLSADAEMEDQLAEQMGDHLQKCNWCREMFEEKYPGELKRSGIISAMFWRPIGGLGYAAAY